MLSNCLKLVFICHKQNTESEGKWILTEDFKVFCFSEQGQIFRHYKLLLLVFEFLPKMGSILKGKNLLQ